MKHTIETVIKKMVQNKLIYNNSLQKHITLFISNENTLRIR